MKKQIIRTLIFILSLFVLGGCAKENRGETQAETRKGTSAETIKETTDKKSPETKPETKDLKAEETELMAPINVTSLKGPTSMGLVKLMEDNDNSASHNTYNFKMVTGADEIVSMLAKKTTDIAMVPANLASVIYNKTEGDIVALNINTLGVLYVVERGDTIKSITDLKGKTIYMTGKGTTPEYVITYLLAQNGLAEEDVTIEYKSEATEVVSILADQEDAIGLIPQPFVTVASSQVEGLHIALDLTEEWNKVSSEGSLITGVAIVRKDFLDSYPDAVETFLSEYKASTEYVNSNVEDAAALIEKYGIVKAAVAKKALPQCNITYIDGESMKKELNGYLSVLLEQNPQSVGGQLPDDAFYFIP